MTWMNIKKATLTKLFSSDNGVVNPADESNKDYVVSMPQAANEAIQFICNAGRRPRHSVEITVEKSSKPQSKLISDLATDYFSPGIDEAYLLTDGVPVKISTLSVVGNRFLVIPADVYGTILWYYDAMPEMISEDTQDASVIDIDDDAVVLLPLYMAAELYKEEDLAMSAYYRNEFETQLAALKRKASGVQGGEFTSVTGWC